MREIKFRVWDKFHESMSSDLLFDKAITINEALSENEDFVFMQYTGLKDKNGVEIYEGDIIKVLGDKCTIFWQQGAFKFQNISNYNIQPLFDFATINKCVAYEVIGNIYENKDLLSEVK